MYGSPAGPLTSGANVGDPLREPLPATSHLQPKQGWDLTLHFSHWNRTPEDQPGHAPETQKTTSSAPAAGEHTGSCAHTQTLVHTLTHAHAQTPVRTLIHPCAHSDTRTHADSHAHTRTLVHTLRHSCTRSDTRAHTQTLMHTLRHSWTQQVTPLSGPGSESPQLSTGRSPAFRQMKADVAIQPSASVAALPQGGSPSSSGWRRAGPPTGPGWSGHRPKE